MKCFLLLLNLALLSSCQSSNTDYHSRSVAEARAYAKRAVETGVVHKGGEEALIAKQSAGKPLEGKWDPKKIEDYVTKYVADHRQIAEINLAATKGKITEKDREFYTEVVNNRLEREAEAKNADAQAAAANLNAAAGQMNQISSYRQNSALMQSTPTSSGYSGFGTGFGGSPVSN